MAEYLPHLFLRGANQVQNFTPPGGGGGQLILPQRDRIGHANRLVQQLNAAWQRATEQIADRRAIAVPAKDGAYFEFISAFGVELKVKGLEDLKAGVRILNVRQEDNGAQQRTKVTVYIPDGKKSLFLKKVNQYAAETTKKGTPRNNELIAPIDDIRLAVLESFWVDDLSSMPGEEPEWCEVWLRGQNEITVNSFFALAEKLQIGTVVGEYLLFPERIVVAAKASREQLINLLESSPVIAEIRKLKHVAGFFVELENAEQAEWVDDLLSRVKVTDNNVSICLLDTGVNSGHRLLMPVISQSDCQAYDPAWGTHDDREHGTGMAGLAVYGDLSPLLQGQGFVEIGHKIESVKILPPGSQNDQKLYGYITKQAVSLAEIEAPWRKRIFCMAVTTKDDLKKGRPSSWSAAVDDISSGHFDGEPKLFFVSAGNAPAMADYPQTNIASPVEDPGQSWNALTVGAYTQKENISDPSFRGHVPLASLNQLSPISTTSVNWDNKWPIKPDILIEGGNKTVDAASVCYACDDLSLLTTSSEIQKRQFDTVIGTSPATALASRLAAQIMTRYPDLWPETVRGLLVHTAEWTTEMKAQFLSNGSSRADYKRLLKICGYGVPDYHRAMECKTNQFTIIAEESIQPFVKIGSKAPRSKEMDLFALPWPKTVLQQLGETEVTMRVTLSYFIEPAPGETGWDNRYRYPSHGLRFDINLPTENLADFAKRLNKAVRDVDEKIETDGASAARWEIGQAMDVGSVHSDFITATAAEISACNFIGIYPVAGWWKYRPHLGKVNSRARYSLIVSLQTSATDIDIYTPVAAQIAVTVPIAT